MKTKKSRRKRETGLTRFFSGRLDAGLWRLMVLLFLVVGVGGCEKIKGPDPNEEYLMKRVDDLEEKVHLLELRIEQLSQSESEGVVAEQEATMIEDSSHPVMPLLIPTGGTDIESQLEEVEVQRDALRLRVRQLEAAPRSELPALLQKQGVSTPAIASLQEARADLVERLNGLTSSDAEALEVGEQIRMIDVKIELEADGLRSRLIEQERVESARIEALRRGTGLVEPEVLSPSPGTEFSAPVVPGVRGPE